MNRKEYNRVIPRDFFNEAKLLKCLGKLELLILDNQITLRSNLVKGSFRILQEPSDGSISCSNYYVYLGNEYLFLFTSLNSRSEWPLIAKYQGEEFFVFDDNGNYILPWGRRG